MNEEEGEVVIKFMNKMRGTELRSSMPSSWKRDSRFVNALGIDVDSRVSLQGIFDGLGVTTSLKGEFVKVLNENSVDGNEMLSVDEVIGVVDDRESKETMRKAFGIADMNEDKIVSNEEEMQNLLKPGEAARVSLLTIEDSIFEMEAMTYNMGDGTCARRKSDCVVNEPTVAASAYGLDVEGDRERSVPVYDMDGSTLDVFVDDRRRNPWRTY